jgi:hypothetical protein
MICWPCIVIYQCNRTNKMHYFIPFIMINSLYVFRALTCSSSKSFNIMKFQWQNILYIWKYFILSMITFIIWSNSINFSTKYTSCCIYSASLMNKLSVRNMSRLLIVKKWKQISRNHHDVHEGSGVSLFFNSQDEVGPSISSLVVLFLRPFGLL